MKFTIRKENDVGLCYSCKHSSMREHISGHMIIRCGAFYGTTASVIDEPVIECNEYRKTGSMSIHKMEDVAYILDDSKGKPIGFLSPGQYKKRYPGEEVT